MTLTRIHPGIAALAVVAGLTAALLIVQSFERRPVPQPPQATAPKVRQEPIQHEPNSALAGIARVIDGDTMNIRGIAVRLDGIDAPETKQTCELSKQTYPLRCEGDRSIDNASRGTARRMHRSRKGSERPACGAVSRRLNRYWNVDG